MTASESWWTEADDAELDVIVHRLTFDYWEHKKTCPNCLPCDEYESWREHLSGCRACQGDAPLTFGPPCDRKKQFLAHDTTACSCLPCPHFQAAITVVLEWREVRQLLSRAEGLRAAQDELSEPLAPPIDAGGAPAGRGNGT